MATDLPSLRRAANEARIGWQPGETVHVGMSRLQARSRLGAIPPGGPAALQQREEAARAGLAAADAGAADRAGGQAAAPPPKFDWRNVSGASYVSPVVDQAGCGSCVAFGATAVPESMVRIAAKEPALRVDLSEAYVYFCLGPDHGAIPCPDGGWWPDDALAAMHHGGVTDELNYRYSDVDQPCRRGSDWSSRLTTFDHWTTRSTIAAMKTYLATVGPMSACFTIYEDFFYYYTGGVYTYHENTSGDVIGGHCVQIVGYDDAQHCWIAKNSWGKEWGENGYFRIAYGSAGIDAEMWGIDGTIASPLIRTTLRVVGAGGGNVWHTQRTGNGSWQTAVNRLDTGTPGDPGSFTAVSAAASINRLHVVGLVGGKLWYTRQRAGAGWAKWESPSAPKPGGVSGWTAVSCAALGDSLDVIALAGGAIWYLRRQPDATWQQTWNRVTPTSGGPGAFTALSSVSVGYQTNVIGLAGGRPWQTTRRSDGTWTALTEIKPGSGPTPGAFTALSAASVDGRLNLVALSGGRPYQLERSAVGAWGSYRELTSTNPAVPTSFSSVACADVGKLLQVVAISGGKLWHTLRQADGTWQGSFGNLGAALTGEPATTVSVDCA